MPIAPGMTDPIIDRFAEQLYNPTGKADAATLGLSAHDVDEWDRVTWERASPAVHECFRERARRMLAGDLMVLPWTWPIGWGKSDSYCPEDMYPLDPPGCGLSDG